jgi:hypothetical protein
MFIEIFKGPESSNNEIQTYKKQAGIFPESEKLRVNTVPF